MVRCRRPRLDCRPPGRLPAASAHGGPIAPQSGLCCGLSHAGSAWSCSGSSVAARAMTPASLLTPGRGTSGLTGHASRANLPAQGRRGARRRPRPAPCPGAVRVGRPMPATRRAASRWSSSARRRGGSRPSARRGSSGASCSPSTSRPAERSPRPCGRAAPDAGPPTPRSPVSPRRPLDGLWGPHPVGASGIPGPDQVSEHAAHRAAAGDVGHHRSPSSSSRPSSRASNPRSSATAASAPAGTSSATLACRAI